VCYRNIGALGSFYPEAKLLIFLAVIDAEVSVVSPTEIAVHAEFIKDFSNCTNLISETYQHAVSRSDRRFEM